MRNVKRLVASMLLLSAPTTAPADPARPTSRPATRPAAGPAWPCPVTVGEVDVRGGKPPQRRYVARLEIRNPHDQPVWFVFRYWQDRPLEHADGRIARPGEDGHVLHAAGYDGARAGGRGRAVVVSDVGHFRAVRVPARGSVRFDRFGFEASSPVRSVDVWEVESLHVNGATPVERWLPYDVTSGADTHIVGEPDWDDLHWDREASRERPDLPREAVRFVAGRVLARWTVPMLGLDPEKDPWR